MRLRRTRRRMFRGKTKKKRDRLVRLSQQRCVVVRLSVLLSACVYTHSTSSCVVLLYVLPCLVKRSMPSVSIYLESPFHES